MHYNIQKITILNFYISKTYTKYFKPINKVDNFFNKIAIEIQKLEFNFYNNKTKIDIAIIFIERTK